MSRNSNVVASLLGGMLLVGAAGCTSASVKVEKKPDDAPYTQTAKRRGPPDHAPAHGWRRKHQFDYYPGAQVYRDRQTGHWFWFESGSWQVGVQVPDTIVIDANSVVTMELDADRPYAEKSHSQPHGKSRGRGHGHQRASAPPHGNH